MGDDNSDQDTYLDKIATIKNLEIAGEIIRNVDLKISVKS